MKALVTGGAGFVGSNLAALLLSQGAEVVLFDSLARNGATLNLEWLRSLPNSKSLLRFTHGDIRKAFDVEQVIHREQPDAIFHLAGQVAMTTSLQDPRRDFEVNVLGSINVLEAARSHSPESVIIYASSNKVYGNLERLDLVEAPTRYQPRKAGSASVDESWPIEFHTPYGCSKGAADQYILDYARCFGLNTVVFRHSTIYGGRQFATYDQGWVSWFVRQALESRRDPDRPAFTISGDGKQVRDLLHVSDAIRAYLGAYHGIAAASGQPFNIGGGVENSLSLLELFQHLEHELDMQLNYVKVAWRSNDQRYFVADNSKALRLFGWSPVTSKSDGIKDAIAWEQSQLRRDAQ